MAAENQFGLYSTSQYRHVDFHTETNISFATCDRHRLQCKLLCSVNLSPRRLPLHNVAFFANTTLYSVDCVGGGTCVLAVNASERSTPCQVGCVCMSIQGMYCHPHDHLRG